MGRKALRLRSLAVAPLREEGGGRPLVAPAILVSSLNSGGSMTLPYVLVASIVLPLILIPAARWLGARAPKAAASEARPPA